MSTTSLRTNKMISLSRLTLGVAAVALSFVLGVRTAADLHPLNTQTEAAPVTASLVSEPMEGDMDGNGQITVGDAILILDIAEGFTDPTSETIKRGDLNNDGRLTVLDALEILHAIEDR